MAAQPFGAAEPCGEREYPPPVLAPQELRRGRAETPEEREAGRQPDHRHRHEPAEDVGFDEERLADPPEAGEEIAEAEPPADGEGGQEAAHAAVPCVGDRPVDQPDEDREGDPEQREGEERRLRQRRNRAGREGYAAAAPPPGQDDRICKAIHGPPPNC